MTTIDRPTSVEPYLAAVAAALAGVPDAERQELLDDLAEHLAELADEDGAPLAERLGAPEAYAADLVASAGIEVTSPAEPDGPAPLLDRLRASIEGARRSPTGTAVLDFLPELRPGWWVLRAWGGLALLAGMSSNEVFPIPDPFGNDLLAIALLVGAAVGSVHLGRRDGVPSRVLTVLGVLGLLVAVANQPRPEYVSDGGGTPVYGGDLTGPDGQYIGNIWAFDGNGDLIDGVYLFDQEGNPIRVADQPTSGPVVPGLFPQPQIAYEYDPVTGEERQVPVAPPVVAIPQLPAATSSTSTTAPAETTTTVPAPAETLPTETTVAALPG